MRAFVFLLILANLLFMSWTQGYFGASSDPDALRVQQQMLADRIKIIARDDPPEGAIKTDKVARAEEKPVAEVCVLISDVPVSDAARFERQLAEKLPTFTSVNTLVASSQNYWVFIPSVATRSDAEKKAAELKKLGISDFFVVTDAGPNRFSVSLGIFSSKQGADDHLQQLRSKGVRSAKVGERNLKPASSSLEIHGPEAQADFLKKLLAEIFPANKLLACKSKLPVVP